MAGSQFTEEQIRRSLLTLAKHAGNSITAQKELAAGGLELSDRTLRDWRTDQYPDLYRELQELHGREIEALLTPEYRELALKAAHAASEAVDTTLAAIRSGDLKDPAAAARNLTIVSGTAMDKLYLATDRPTSISEHRGASEILNALESRYGNNTVNSTAVEDKTSSPLLPDGATPNARETPELPVSTG